MSSLGLWVISPWRHFSQKQMGQGQWEKRLKGDKWPQTILMMYYSQSAVFTHGDTDVTQTDAVSPRLPDAGHGASSQPASDTSAWPQTLYELLLPQTELKVCNEGDPSRLVTKPLILTALTFVAPSENIRDHSCCALKSLQLNEHLAPPLPMKTNSVILKCWISLQS